MLWFKVFKLLSLELPLEAREVDKLVEEGDVPFDAKGENIFHDASGAMCDAKEGNNCMGLLEFVGVGLELLEEEAFTVNFNLLEGN